MNQFEGAFGILLDHIRIGVVVCRRDGQILATSKSASLILEDEALPPLESVSYLSEILDPLILEDAFYALEDRLDAPNPRFHFVARLSSSVFLQIDLLPVLENGLHQDQIIVKLEELVEDADHSVPPATFQSTIEQVRSHLSGIRAAIETMMAYPEMDELVVQQFRQIIYDQALTLSKQVEEVQEEWINERKSQMTLEVMHIRDWERFLQDQIGSQPDLKVRWASVQGGAWLEGDRFSWLQSLLFLLKRIRNSIKNDSFNLMFEVCGEEVHLDVLWVGPAIRGERLEKWEDQVITADEMVHPLTLGEVFRRHQVSWLLNPEKDVRLRLVFPVYAPRTFAD
ncbi:MAG TPA: hypothetical protein PLL64_02390 [Rhodothermales bacterium]|nr:hypothetical protein [Rhodothermales bacterium]HRR09136.1 hypothetical protein [Rhodothermales bacterium]